MRMQLGIEVYTKITTLDIVHSDVSIQKLALLLS
jgi:hypothetical protein